MRPPPPMSTPLPPAPILPPPLPSPTAGSEVQETLAGGAPSRNKRNGVTNSGQEALPVETNSPPVTTPWPSLSRAPPRAEEEGERAATHRARETPQMEHNNPPVSTPPSPIATTSFPAGAPSPPQRTRKPPADLKDFVCDHITSGGQESLTGGGTEKLTVKSGSYEHHVNINFDEGGVGGRTTTPGAHSPTLVQQTRCPAFSYADAVRGRRILSTHIQA